MNLITNYNSLTEEYPEEEFFYFKVTESDYPTYYVPVFKGLDTTNDAFFTFFNFIPDFSTNNSGRIENWQSITTYYFKNTSKKDRSLTVECLTKETSILFSGVKLDNNIDLFTIDEATGTITFCLKAMLPITCTSSTAPVAFFETLPDFGPVADTLKVLVNGVEYSPEEIEGNNAPFLLGGDMYGINFINKTEECLLIEFLYEGDEIHFPSSSTVGIASESLPGVFRLSLAAQHFEPTTVRVEFIDKKTGYVSSNILNEGQEYTVAITLLSDNPNPSETFTVTYNGNSHVLSFLNEPYYTFDIVVPENKTWDLIPYTYSFEISSENEIRYEGDSKPEMFVSYYYANNLESVWNYSYDNSNTIVTSSANHLYDVKFSKIFFKEHILKIQLDPIYAGLSVKDPYNAVVDSSGLLTIDLSKSYPYNSGWTTDSKTYQMFRLVNSKGTSVAAFAYSVYLDTISLNINSSQYPNSYTSTTTLEGNVNNSLPKIRLGPLPYVTKIYLGSHQDAPDGARLVPPSTFLDVVDGYAYYQPPTPTQPYNPTVSSSSYKVTRILITVAEGDPRFINMMKQTREFKYVVNN